jgi:tRNA1Val (adenine37-N6)-methyltransferase
MEISPDETFLNGRLTVRQPQDGYRFSIDAALLADFVACKDGQTILDLGTGCGIIPLILAARHPGVHVIGVEIQASLASLAASNVRANHLEERIRILNHDIKNLTAQQVPERIHQVVCNPPYRRLHSGRINPHQEKAGARHEIFACLADFVAASARVLQVSGRLSCIYPAARLVDLVDHMRQAGVEPKKMRTVHSRAGEGARLVLLTGVKGGRPGLDVAVPLVIYQDDGAYTPAVERAFLP